jgi:hypothetical protein
LKDADGSVQVPISLPPGVLETVHPEAVVTIYALLAIAIFAVYSLETHNVAAMIGCGKV